MPAAIAGSSGARAESVMAACVAEWKQAQAAGTTGGATWPQFLAKCKTQVAHSASPGAQPTQGGGRAFTRARCGAPACAKGTPGRPETGRRAPSSAAPGRERRPCVARSRAQPFEDRRDRFGVGQHRRKLGKRRLGRAAQVEHERDPDRRSDQRLLAAPASRWAAPFAGRGNPVFTCKRERKRFR